MGEWDLVHIDLDDIWGFSIVGHLKVGLGFAILIDLSICCFPLSNP